MYITSSIVYREQRVHDSNYSEVYLKIKTFFRPKEALTVRTVKEDKIGPGSGFPGHKAALKVGVFLYFTCSSQFPNGALQQLK